VDNLCGKNDIVPRNINRGKESESIVSNRPHHNLGKDLIRQQLFYIRQKLFCRGSIAPYFYSIVILSGEISIKQAAEPVNLIAALAGPDPGIKRSLISISPFSFNH